MGSANSNVYKERPTAFSAGARRKESHTTRTPVPCNVDSGNIIFLGDGNLTACFNSEELTTYWIHQRVFPKPGDKITRKPMNFNQQYFENANVKESYKNSGYERGHLAAAGNSNNPNMTHALTNTSPQIPELNRRNWKIVENTIQKMAEKLEQLDVISGTLEKVDYLNKEGKKIPIYLYFYKVVVDSRLKKGIVFVGINDTKNTYSDLYEDFIESLQDISNSLDYLDKEKLKKFQKTEDGKIYCYAVPDFVNLLKNNYKMELGKLPLPFEDYENVDVLNTLDLQQNTEELS